MKHLIALFSIIIFFSQTKANTITFKPSQGENQTEQLQRYIDSAAAIKGTLFIPAGLYRCATLQLRSDMTFEIGQGAVIQSLDDLSQFPQFEAGHNKDRGKHHFIVAQGAKNLTVKGLGTVDGSGPAFWEKTRKSEVHFYRENKQRVSPMFDFKDCENLRLQDFTITNSPGWTVHLRQCNNVIASGIVIKNDPYGPNTDGFDINGCNNVLVTGCNITTGDDAIVIKATEDAGPSSDILVTNNILYTQCAAMKVGTESHHDFTRINFDGNLVRSAGRILDITICDGGNASHITCTNTVGSLNSALPLGRHIIMNCVRRKPESKLGSISHVIVDNMTVRTDGRIMIGAAESGRISQVTLSNINIDYVFLNDPQPMAARTEGDRNYAKDLPQLRAARAAICLENVDDVRISNIGITWPSYPVPAGWRLLESGQSFNHPHLEGANLAKVKEGTLAPAFYVLWGNNVNRLQADLGFNTPSKKGQPLHNVNGKQLKISGL